MSKRVLFILKNRENAYGSGDSNYSGSYYSSGLLNSATFVVDMLKADGIDCEIVQVQDNNCIDREVTRYRPTHVIIEALWVVPDKFAILSKLHPNVQWIVRGHSEIPFLSNEGIAIDWINQYARYASVSIAANSKESLEDLRSIIASNNPKWTKEQVETKVIYLPNYYPVAYPYHKSYGREWPFIDIACFGAIRPLKNNLIQAVAAIEYADHLGKILYFHVNGSRSEQGGNSNLKNIRALFEHNPKHFLVEHDWLDHEKFLELLAERIDISLNVSFSETFNIVAADSVFCDVALVTSPEIRWSSKFSQADPTSSESIVKAMKRVTSPVLARPIKMHNLHKLEAFSKEAKKAWVRWAK